MASVKRQKGSRYKLVCAALGYLMVARALWTWALAVAGLGSTVLKKSTGSDAAGSFLYLVGRLAFGVFDHVNFACDPAGI